LHAAAARGGHLKSRMIPFRRRSSVQRQLASRRVAVALQHEGAAIDGGRGRHHLVPRQRARLVGADHRDRAQCFDRREVAHDGIAPRHRLDAHGQRDREHRRQTLRDRRDRQAHHDHEHLGKVAPGNERPVKQEKRGDEQDEQRQPACEHIHLANERRGERFDLRKQSADPPDLGGRAGCHHDTPPKAARHQRTAERHARAIAERHVGSHRIAALLDRHGLAGEDGFLHGEPACPEKPEIGGNAVARIKENDVARYQVFCCNRQACAAAQHVRVRREHLADRVHRAFGAPFLDEADHSIRQHDHKNDPGVAGVPEPGCQHRGGDQHVDEDIVELREKPPQRASARRFGQAVGTGGRASPLRVRIRQAQLGAADMREYVGSARRMRGGMGRRRTVHGHPDNAKRRPGGRLFVRIGRKVGCGSRI
jgi:hypothetical protein